MISMSEMRSWMAAAANLEGILIYAGVGVAVEHTQGGQADVLGDAAADFGKKVSAIH